MADTAVLVIDMMNAYRHPDADKLAPHVAAIIDPLGRLVARARDRDDVDVIYVNDNYGDFTAQPHATSCRAHSDGEHPELVEPVAPRRRAPVPDESPPQRLLCDTAGLPAEQAVTQVGVPPETAPLHFPPSGYSCRCPVRKEAT